MAATKMAEQQDYTRCIDIGHDVQQYTEYEEFLKAVGKTDEERYLLGQLTKEQANSPAWYLARLFRITSSVCSQLVGALEKVPWFRSHNHKLKPLDSLINRAKLLYNKHNTAFNMLLCCAEKQQRSFTPTACQWGILHEDEARKCYLATNPHLTCQQTGIVVSRSGALGASPDGVLYRSKEAALDPNRWQEGELLEIKCPYKVRDTKGNSAEDTRSRVVDQLSYLKWGRKRGIGHDVVVELNQKSTQGRQYYHQVQMGMYVLGVTCCHFVIWTPHIVFSFPVQYNTCWGMSTAPRLDMFWSHYFMRVVWQNKVMCKGQHQGADSLQTSTTGGSTSTYFRSSQFANRGLHQQAFPV